MANKKVEATIEAINTWIDDTNQCHKKKRQSCVHLHEEFKDFYNKPFLEKAYFVVLEELPKPDFPELRALGFSSFIDMPANGITYKDTYYILPHILQVKRVHFHELVHVLQWSFLGASNFISRYMLEIMNFGYENAPLEKMAYALDARYSEGAAPLDVESFVKGHL